MTLNSADKLHRLTPDTATSAMSPNALPRVALIGIQGYGVQHIVNLRRLHNAGRLELVGAADPNASDDLDFPVPVPVFASLEELLAADTAPDVVIIATPIQTHTPLALTALSAGVDVYLEKPPAASLEQYEQLRETAAQAGRIVQVGFQSLGSHALAAIDQIIADGTIGTLRGVSATGQWVRERAYFKRSPWAGKRQLNGCDVVDGVATNPLAHAIATALHIAGAHGTDDVINVDTDLYHAHEIESDDTSVIRIRTANGPTVTCALTLCATESEEPYVTIRGTDGQAVFYYTLDVLQVSTAKGQWKKTYGRSNLLENLLDHVAGDTPLLMPLESSGAFMRVLEQIRTAPPPKPVDPGSVQWVGEGDQAHPVIDHLSSWIHRATEAEATFRELGVPWTQNYPAAEVQLSGRTVARYHDGGHIKKTSSPRPYLHPITTLGGTVVSDHLPLDHVWHLGAGVAIQDVSDINFWGGRSYRREEGRYTWRRDHGHIRRVGNLEQAPGRLSENLEWVGPDDAVLLKERRNWSFQTLDDWDGVGGPGNGAWRLGLEYTLSPTADEPVSLGSPGSHGRDNGGYGGFFWRLPPCTDVNVRTVGGTGEDEVHGSVAPWLAWTADFNGQTATLIFLNRPQALDPWFVRVSGYPGVGLALAWDAPVETTRENPLIRSVSVIVADGLLTGPELDDVVRKAGRRE